MEGTTIAGIYSCGASNFSSPERYDYEEVTMESAQQMMAHLAKIQASGELDNVKLNGYALKVADNFSYTDPVDKSVAKNQGIRFVFEDGTRNLQCSVIL